MNNHTWSKSMKNSAGWIVAAVVGFAVLVGGMMYGIPKYRVWALALRGEAALREAEWSRQIRIQEASAEMEAAKLLAQRDSLQAMGVASANRILGESLRDNEEYLRYVWITQGLATGNHDVVYVPTEANLPILEATRRPSPAQP